MEIKKAIEYFKETLSKTKKDNLETNARILMRRDDEFVVVEISERTAQLAIAIESLKSTYNMTDDDLSLNIPPLMPISDDYLNIPKWMMNNLELKSNTDNLTFIQDEKA